MTGASFRRFGRYPSPAVARQRIRRRVLLLEVAVAIIAVVFVLAAGSALTAFSAVVVDIVASADVDRGFPS